MIAFLFVLAALALVVVLFTGQFRGLLAASRGDRTTTTGRPNEDSEPRSSWSAFLTGLVALTAVLTVFPDGQGVTVSMAIGVLASITTLWSIFSLMADLFYGCIGAIASVLTLADVFSWESAPIWQAILLLSLFALVYAASALLQVVTSSVTLRDFPILGLELFGGLTLVLWLTSPFGAKFLGIDDGWRFVFSVALTVVIAALAAKRGWSDLVFGAAGLMIAAGALLVQSMGIETPDARFGVTIVTLMTFIVGFVLALVVFSFFRRTGSVRET